MGHRLLYVNHSPTCRSNKLLTPLEVVSLVLGNPFRLYKRGPLSTVVCTKHNVASRITSRTCSLMPRSYNGGQNLYPISALLQDKGFSNGTPYLVASVFGFAITLVSTGETHS